MVESDSMKRAPWPVVTYINPLPLREASKFKTQVGMFTISTCGLKLPHSNWRGTFYVHWHTQTCTCYHSLKETSRKHDCACQVWWTRLSPSQVWLHEKPVFVLTQQPSPPTANILSVLMEKCKSVLLMNACGCQHCVLCPGPTLVGKSYENGSQKKFRGFFCN